MKRLFASVAGIIGLAALARWLAERRHPVPADQVEPVEATPAESAAADPAEELRRKLADARETEPVAAATEAPEETLDERRARVHAKAREAIDSMGGSSTDDGAAAS
jgi:hypothetical protein